MKKTNPSAVDWRIMLALSLGVTMTIAYAAKWAISKVGATTSDVAADDARILEANRVSRSTAISRQREADDRYREDALAWEREFMQARQDRRWREETADRPDHREARQSWQRQVDEIREQIAEAEPIQEALGDEGPLSEGTVLWHRQQQLKKLEEDAPPAY